MTRSSGLSLIGSIMRPESSRQLLSSGTGGFAIVLLSAAMVACAGAGVLDDGGLEPADASIANDAGATAPGDAGAPAPIDSGSPGHFDAGSRDAGSVDAGSNGHFDAGPRDAGSSDAGSSDSGTNVPGDAGVKTGRHMERLGRGVVAVRNGARVFVSWRLLGLDPAGIGFNVYRSTGNRAASKLNGGILTEGTNYGDTTADLTQTNAYFVMPVIGGLEQPASATFTLPANPADEPCVVVSLRSGGPIHFVWVGDLDGDGEYDYVVDRQTSP